MTVIRKLTADILRLCAFLVLTCTFFTSCDESRIFEKNIPVGKAGWNYNDTLKYQVNLEDTTALYNLYINLRHTDQYQFRNIWIMVATTFPDGNKHEERVELELAPPSGIWAGECSGNICFYRGLIQSRFRLNESGLYKFDLVPDMRVNPLKDILDAGIRIEKSDG